jgi:ferrous iron transport protein B
MEAVREAAVDVLLLVGNPNVGKSVIFGHLTGKYVTVSNYPGTTVDVSRGRFRRGATDCEIIDTPGIYSLHPQSEDELVTRDLLLAYPRARVILVLDAKNLQRGLLLVQQLAELDVPFCIALNMVDESRSLGLQLDVAALCEAVGVPVVPTVATSGQGLGALVEAIAEARPSSFRGRFSPDVEEPRRQVQFILNESAGRTVQPLLALDALINPESLPPQLAAQIDPDGQAMLAEVSSRFRRASDLPPQSRIYRNRMAQVGEVLHRAVRRPEREPGGISAWLSHQALHPLRGLLVAAVVLAVVYLAVGVFGAGTLVNLLEGGLFERVINPAAIAAANRLLPWTLLRDFLVGPYGLITMALTYSFAIILPVVGTFFIAFGFLEDSGYMPRLAVMANTFFRRMGLHGKAILPMILGLGCDTMATLTARIMDTRKERVLVTLLLALGVPCSAQLGVILGMLGAVSWWGVAIWFGVITAVLLTTGAVAARVIPGARSDFILELPPMRLPGLKNILVKTGARITWYLREAVPLFLLGTTLLFALDKTGLLEWIRSAAAPLVGKLLGLPREATDAFLVGFVRRDYGAAGLFQLQREGWLDGRQIVVSLVIITLYVPCIANFFVMIKERGLRAALAIVGVILVIATAVGGGLNQLLLLLGANP